MGSGACVLDPALGAIASEVDPEGSLTIMGERKPRRDAVTEAEFRRLAESLAETVATVRDLAARLSPIPEKFADLSSDVRGLKGAVEAMQTRIQSGDSAFEALRKEQALQGARLDKLESASAAVKSRAWDLFMAALPWLGGAALVGLGAWLRSLASGG